VTVDAGEADAAGHFEGPAFVHEAHLVEDEAELLGQRHDAASSTLRSSTANSSPASVRQVRLPGADFSFCPMFVRSASPAACCGVVDLLEAVEVDDRSAERSVLR